MICIIIVLLRNNICKIMKTFFYSYIVLVFVSKPT